MAALRDGLTTPDGRRLAFERRGSGAPLICHPGGPGAPPQSLADLGGLDGDRTLVVLHPRGAGDSDPPARPNAYALGDYVADLELLRAHLGLDRIDVLGHSHGSFVALAYAAAHPDRARRLVLVAACAHIGAAELEAIDAAMGERAGEPWYEDAVAAMAAEEDAPDDAAIGALVARELPLYFGTYGEREAAYGERVAGARWHAAALRWFNDHELTAFDLRPQLPRIAAPALVVVGERDFILGPVAARDLLAGLPAAEPLLLEGVGHFPWVEAPERFRPAVREFVR